MSDPRSNDPDSSGDATPPSADSVDSDATARVDSTDAGSESKRPSRFKSLRSRLEGTAEAASSDDADRDSEPATGSEDEPPSDPIASPDSIDGVASAVADEGDSATGADEWEWSTAVGDDSGEPEASESDTSVEATNRTDATATAGGASDGSDDAAEGNTVDGYTAGGAGARGPADPIEAGTRTDNRSDDRNADRGERVWDRGADVDGASPATSTGGGGGPVSEAGSPSTASSEDPVTHGWDVDAGLDEGLPADLDPGMSVLVQSETRDDRTEHACHTLLRPSREDVTPRVLLVRYQKLDPDRLAEIAAGTDHLKLIAIGYTQSVPASVDDVVDSVQITNPNDITRLGIVVSGTIDDWADEGRPIAVCFDSLNVVLNYRDVKSTFRFLHVLLNTLHGGGAVSHFHIDPMAGNPQDLNTLKPLFDEVVAIDSTGVHTE